MMLRTSTVETDK